jgi:hypothetical protein
MSDSNTPEYMSQISSAIAAGRKIEAIKIYREESGKSLADAKTFIEELSARLKAEDPETYARVNPAKGAGCASMIVALLGSGVLLVAIMIAT